MFVIGNLRAAAAITTDSEFKKNSHTKNIINFTKVYYSTRPSETSCTWVREI